MASPLSRSQRELVCADKRTRRDRYAEEAPALMITNPTPTLAPTVTVRAGKLVLRDLELDDPAVLAEALRWTSGRRGPEVTARQAEAADLSPFATAALTLGSQMLTYGAETGGVATLAGSVVQLTDRAQSASAALAADVARTSKSVSEAATTATREAARQTSEALTAAAKLATTDISIAVSATRENLQAELARLLVGAEAPVAKQVQALVARQMAESAVTLQRTFTETLGSVTATLDVGNPASPFAKLESRIGERQDRQHGELTAQFREVREAVTAATTAATAATAVAAARALSPAKGRPFEEAVGSLIEQIAVGMGGAYTATGETVGALRGCKKGDGVIELPSPDGVGSVRIAVEMTTTGASRRWAGYLQEAERNREAHASIGIVPSSDLVPGGGVLAPVGQHRLVIAVTEDDDPALLRAACVLLALRAQRDLVSERSRADLTVVDNRLAEAQALLGALTEVLKTATGVKAGAAKVVLGLEGLHETLTRCLSQARSALVAGADPVEPTAACDPAAA